MCQAAKDVRSSYDALVDLLETIEHFLGRLEIYIGLLVFLHLSFAPPPLLPSPFTLASRSSLFPQIERSRITRLVSRLATPFAPRVHPLSGSRRLQNPSSFGSGSGIPSPDKKVYPVYRTFCTLASSVSLFTPFSSPVSVAYLFDRYRVCYITPRVWPH